MLFYGDPLHGAQRRLSPRVPIKWRVASTGTIMLFAKRDSLEVTYAACLVLR